MMQLLCMMARSALAVALVFGHISTASADDYPTKPVRLVVPSAPGGGTDIVSRLIARGLSDTWSQSVVVDNRGGAGGMAGVVIVAKHSAPDGYTMLLGSSGHLSFMPALYRELPFDPQKDLQPVSLAASQPFVVAVSQTIPVRSIKDLIAYAKSHMGTLRYGSGGAGSASHLGTELLQLTAGISLVHVPYKGTGPGMAALMSGEIQLILAGLGTVLPHAKGDKLRALAVTGARRSAVAPHLPTVAEAGVPGYDFDVWYGVMFPGRTPRTIVTKTHAEIVRLLQSPTVKQRFASAGVEPVTNTPEEFSKLIRSEAPKWRRVAQEANIKLE